MKMLIRHELAARGRRVVLCAALSLISVPGFAEVSATAILSPPGVPLFRTATYVVEIEGPKGLAVPKLDVFSGIKDIEVSVVSPTSEAAGEERERVRVSYVLDPMKAGEYTIPGTTLDLGNGQEVALPAMTLVVREPSPAEIEQAGQFVDIGDPALVAPPPSRAAWYAGGALALIAAIAAGLWYWRKLHQPEEWTPPALKPWQVAQNRLEQLAARRLPHQGMHGPYYVDLSAILRYYIEDRFHLRAPERTTPEFLDEASRAGVLDEAQQAALAQFLRHCDRVKFAQYEPSFEEMEKSFEAVRQFVLETTPSAQDGTAMKEAA